MYQMINRFSSYLCLLDPGYGLLLSSIRKEIQECCFSAYYRFGCRDPFFLHSIFLLLSGEFHFKVHHGELCLLSDLKRVM